MAHRNGDLSAQIPYRYQAAVVAKGHPPTGQGVGLGVTRGRRATGMGMKRQAIDLGSGRRQRGQPFAVTGGPERNATVGLAGRED